MSSEVGTISEGEFKNLCDEIYRDRLEIYGFNPGAARAEALLWMLTGCLISLLSIREAELQAVTQESDSYADAVRALVRERARPPFNPAPYLEDLVRRAQAG
jgi:hypothetical protein